MEVAELNRVLGAVKLAESFLVVALRRQGLEPVLRELLKGAVGEIAELRLAVVRERDNAHNRRITKAHLNEASRLIRSGLRVVDGGAI